VNDTPSRILVADDDPVIRRVVRHAVEAGGWMVETVADGSQALAALERTGGPRIAVLDWMMPGIEGIDVCRRVRARVDTPYVYLLILTTRTRTEDVVRALDAGADDYLAKPFHGDELRSRLRVAERIIRLESTVAERAVELERARQRSEQLEGLLPICMECKRIRDDSAGWTPLEEFVARRSEATFSHGLCEDCHRELHADATRRLPDGTTR
jgi:phosphoserine phosphatase RsbU/P